MRTKEETEYLEMFADWLKAKREARGWSQQNLADKVNLSKSSICLYEQARREPTLSVIRELSKAFNVTIGEVMQEKELRCKCAKCS